MPDRQDANVAYLDFIRPLSQIDPANANTQKCKSSNDGKRSETAWFIEACRAAGITSAKAIADLCDLPGEERAKALIYDRVKITGETMTTAFRKRPDLLLEYAMHCGCTIIFNRRLLAAAEQFARVAQAERDRQ